MTTADLFTSARPLAPPARRWFLKCRLCLSVVVVELALDAPAPHGARCGACEGNLVVMGHVQRTRLVTRTHFESPCDSRCTNAPGPKCECSCGAVNHGTGRLVEIDTTAPVPRVTPVDGARSRAIAEEFKAAKAAALAAIAHLGKDESEARARGEWLDGAGFARLGDYRRALAWVNDACWLKTQKGRLAALAAVVTHHTKGQKR